MPPPAGNALETVRLLTLEQQQQCQQRGLSASFGAASGERGPVAGEEDDGWELQKSLLLSEYGEGERGVVDLMEKLIAVREMEGSMLPTIVVCC